MTLKSCVHSNNIMLYEIALKFNILWRKSEGNVTMNLVYVYNYISVDIHTDFNIFNAENAGDHQVLDPSFEGEWGIF